MSPGWHSRYSQMRDSVAKRTPRTLPDFNSERFCSVIPTNCASSLDVFLRSTSIRSRWMVIATSGPSYDARAVFGDARGFLEDLRKHQEKRGQEQRPQLFTSSAHRKFGNGITRQRAQRRDLQRLRDIQQFDRDDRQGKRL